MKVRSDDELYRYTFKYMGPPGYTLPWQFTPAQIGVFLAIFFVLTILGLLTFRSAYIFGVTFSVSMVSTWAIFQKVDADVPARKVIKTAVVDAQKLGAPTETRVDRISVSHVRFRPEITEEVTR